MNAQPEQEFCPRCGRWVDQLRERSGWCAACSGPEAVDGQVCVRCNHPRPADCYSTRSRWNLKVCRMCRSEARIDWKTRHPERTREYEAERKRSYGRGVCPECGHSKQLRADGSLGSHQHGRGRWKIGEPMCLGAGQMPESR
jgi:hypothetical protein